ncbi:hypothetical protein E2562_017964 [Oryza meyeriana var. granulata]|uniref:Uncharacterized protein n=1 Tax=Oryza meyeriana var. granulata TaxID=110450 RepID=A0A6G1F953_9ORYZ|nr:hypothetical protein E2562_017964 [Oryza meyeriana var. granulata]
MWDQLQLQLVALVSEHRLLRERERAAREELHASSQRWKEAEEGHRREARELRAEVAARDDALWRLESRIKCLENENEQLERNEKELKENMEGLLQSKEAFIKHYEAEKLNTHRALFSSVGKEVAVVKQVLGDVKCLVGEKENVVSDLKGKVEKISVLERDFVEKLSFLEEKISNCQLELRNRARMIYELRERLEAEKLNNKFQPQLEEISICTELTSEKQAMLMELHNMEIALHKFQDIFSSIGHEVMERCPPVSSQDVQEDVNKEQLESIPGSQCKPPNEHTMIPVVDEAATTTNVESQSEINPGSKQAQSQSSLMHSALPSPEPANANAETAGHLHGSEDIDMRTDSVNPNLESQNQS